MFGIELPVILSFVGGLVLICIILKLLSFSIGTMISFVFNGLIGAVILYLLNMFGAATILGFTLPLTWLTALIVGFFGVPGVIIVIVLKLIAII